jgi:hypothetical protein
MTYMGLPIAAIAAVSAVKTPGQYAWGWTALVIVALEALALIALFIRVYGVYA